MKKTCSITESGFKKLLMRFPEHGPLLNENSRSRGPKREIDIDRVMSRGSSNGTLNQLIDELYRLAYPLRRDRFLSYYYQVNTILQLPRGKTQDILEIGKGNGIFQSLMCNFDYQVLTLDIQQRFQPEIVGDIRNIPVKSDSFDVICAFEILEHLPFRYFKDAVNEMRRCARHYVFISLPCHVNSLSLSGQLKLRQRFLNRLSFDFSLFTPLGLQSQAIDESKLIKREDAHNPHYWEVNRRGYSKKRILDLLGSVELKVIRQFHNPDFANHYFVLCQL